jgi:YidC/Oxa1 family membrane protein insertase
LNKQTIIAMVLIAIVTLGYMYWMSHQQAKVKARMAVEAAGQGDTPAKSAEGAKTPLAPAGRPQVAETPIPAATKESPAVEAPQTLRVERPKERPKGQDVVVQPPGGVFELTFDPVGASLKQVKLLRLYTNYTHSEHLTILDAYEDHRTLQMTTPPGKTDIPFDLALYDIVEQDKEHIIFRHRFEEALEVEKGFYFPEGEQHITLKVSLRNLVGTPLDVSYELTAAARIVPEYEDQNYLSSIVGWEDGQKIKTESKAPSALEKDGYYHHSNPVLPILWAGSATKYFAVLLKPAPSREVEPWIASAHFRAMKASEVARRLGGPSSAPFDNSVSSLVTKEAALTPDKPSVTHEYMLFIGPKDAALMARPEYKAFAPIVNYGWVDFISVPLLYILRAFNSVVHNFGVAIILLTFLVRGALHPLNKKAQVSMYRMQQLQPEIKKLQEKYKNDKQRLGREQMGLFKKHSVNPMGGCLPLFLQFPIIIGLYNALAFTIDLRDAPFVWWVKDLSQQDTVAFIAGRPVNILPILMIAATIVQQVMSPKSPDPQQRKQQRMMMIFSTVILGYFFYISPSGLALYWLVSTLFGIAEQKIIQRHLKKHAPVV